MLFRGVRRYFRLGQGERTALITRFRRAYPGSERTSGGYIERPIIPPISAVIAEGDYRGNGGVWPAAVW